MEDDNRADGAFSLAPRNRAPLGVKTTNAKAKSFQTPGPPIVANDAEKSIQKGATTRKVKPRVSHAELTKLEILGDKDELDEREIEYMPPKPKGIVGQVTYISYI